MPNIDPAMMQQAMMQGAMGMGGPPQGAPSTEPALDQGDTTPEERAGRGGDTLLAHVTPGEVVVPIELIDNEMAMRKLRSLFEKHDVDMDQYTVGHEANSINPETGNPEFGNWFKKSFKKVKRTVKKAIPNELKSSKNFKRTVKKVIPNELGRGFQKGWDYVRGKRQEEKARQAAIQAGILAARAAKEAARIEGIKQRKKIDAMIKNFNAKMAASKKRLIAEGKAQKKKMVGEGLVQDLKFKSKISSIAKERANLGAPAGVTSEASVPTTEQPKGKSSWRRARKKRKIAVQRRPGQ